MSWSDTQIERHVFMHGGSHVSIALREVLSKGESWGFKLMGVCLTKVLLVKVVSGALTLLTVLTKFVDEGEPESGSGI